MAPAPDQATPRLVCGREGCKKPLPSGNVDNHSRCWRCRTICSPDSPCNECESWPMDQRIAARAYQDRMAKQRDRQNKARAAARVAGIPAQPSISPEDSVSNAPSVASSRYSDLSIRMGKMEENMSKLLNMFDVTNPSSPIVNLVTQIARVEV